MPPTADNQDELHISAGNTAIGVSTTDPPSLTCERCGAAIGGRKGSITGWIFGGNVCHCKSAGNTADSGDSVNTSLDTSDQRALITDRKAAAEAALPERYEVLDLFAEGGMGRVYRAFDQVSQTVVAVKVLRPELIQDADSIRRFTHEAKASLALKHPNIVQVIEHGMNSKSCPYISMEYLKGFTLAQLLEKEVYIDTTEAILIFKQVCQALIFAHSKGVVHRDIKPSNIMVIRNENEFVVKLIDFGIAKVRQSKDSETQYLTQTGEIFGSPVYMSPEQGLGEKLDARSDIYSLGCVMYEGLTGSALFTDDNPVKTVYHHLNSVPPSITNLRQEVSNDFEKVVMHCLEKSPSNRYSSVSQLLGDLEKLSAGKSINISASRSLPTARFAPAPAWTRILATIISLAAAAAVAYAIVRFFNFELTQIIGLSSATGYLFSGAVLVIGLVIPFGKEMCGLAITDEYGGVAAHSKLFTRDCLKVACVLLFPAVVLFELFRVFKQAVAEDMPFKFALKQSVSKAPWDRITRTTVRACAKNKVTYVWGAALVLLFLLPISNIRAGILSVPAVRQTLQAAFPKEFELRKDNPHEWLILRLLEQGVFASIFAESSKTNADGSATLDLSERSGLLETNPHTKDNQRLGLLGKNPHVLVYNQNNGDQAVTFDETTIKRFAGTKEVSIQSNGNPVFHCRFTDDGGKVSGSAVVNFPDGTKSTSTITDANEVKALRSMGYPIDLAWYFRDGKFSYRLYSPTLDAPYRAAMVEFLERSKPRFRADDRCFSRVGLEPEYGRSKWRNALEYDYIASLKLFTGDKPIQKNVIVQPGKRYLIELNFTHGMRTSKGRHEFDLLVNGAKHTVVFERKGSKREFFKSAYEFTASSPVAEIVLENLKPVTEYDSAEVSEVKLFALQ